MDSDTDDVTDGEDTSSYQNTGNGEDYSQQNIQQVFNHQHLNINNNTNHTNEPIALSKKERFAALKMKASSEYRKDCAPGNENNSEDEEPKTNKEIYLRALAAEGLRVGRQMSRSLLKYSSSSSNRRGTKEHQQFQKSNSRELVSKVPKDSPAVETLLRVFPMRKRIEIDNALHKTCGDVLKAIELLLGQPQGSGNASPFGKGPSAEQESVIDLAIDSHAKFMEQSFANQSNFLHLKQPHFPNPNLNGGRLPFPNVGSENQSAFSLFGHYSAAAAAAVTRFQPNNKRFIPSMFPYNLPSLHHSEFFHGTPLPLVTAAAMNSAVMNLVPGGVHHHQAHRLNTEGNGNDSINVTSNSGLTSGSVNCNNSIERENGTPPTSCSGSDRASYSE